MTAEMHYDKQTVERMKRVVKIILGPMFFAITLVAVNYWMHGDIHGLFGDSIEVSMRKDADRLNPTLPKMIDEVTRLDHVAAGPGNRFTYDYTLMSLEVTAIPPEKLNEFKAILFENVCSRLPEFRRNGTLVVYRYKSRSGDDIAEIQIPTVDCPK
jgi:hypothetical protein